MEVPEAAKFHGLRALLAVSGATALPPGGRLQMKIHCRHRPAHPFGSAGARLSALHCLRMVGVRGAELSSFC